MRRILLIALTAAWAVPATALASPEVSSDPALYPKWRASTPDYTVRCAHKEKVRLKVDPRGSRVSVGGGKAHTGRFEKTVELVPGRGVRIEVEGGRRYDVRCLPGDFGTWRITREASKPRARWYVLTPTTNDRKAGYTVVFDSHGVPVWWMKTDPPPFDGKLLPDGNLAWTRWVFSREPSGYFEEHALDGSLVRTWDAVGIHSNPHELQVFPDGSSMYAVYRPRDHVDLSRFGGPNDATVLDGEVQELDPAGKLVWSWSTAGHVALSETKHWYPKLFKDSPVQLADGRGAYDLVHLNAIERVSGGKVVVSLRHTDAVYEIDQATGKVLWKLGGTKTAASLKIEHDPYGSHNFGGQHDVRVPGKNRVTMFDNGSRRDRPPRAVEYRIDPAKGTARLVNAVDFDRVKESTCCGGARRLPGGHWAVSWGNNPYAGELTAGGKQVLTLRFSGGRHSYRIDPVLSGRLSRSALRRGMDAMAP
ncbi:MAG: arylsulfotransferase family protein [Thermoleophilaceae bacterium]